MFSRKQMIKLLAPLIVEQIMAVLVGMVDEMCIRDRYGETRAEAAGKGSSGRCF